MVTGSGVEEAHFPLIGAGVCGRALRQGLTPGYGLWGMISVLFRLSLCPVDSVPDPG